MTPKKSKKPPITAKLQFKGVRGWVTVLDPTVRENTPLLFKTQVEAEHHVKCRCSVARMIPAIKWQVLIGNQVVSEGGQ